MALFACALLTLVLALYIFFTPGRLRKAPVKTRLSYLRERKEVIYDNLRDLNFEFKAGKMPEADYESLRAGLEEEAAGVLAEIEREAALAARRAGEASPKRAKAGVR